jgi:mannose-1-phosphate guanylyltransferase/mannose-6-phosphate isomerase
MIMADNSKKIHAVLLLGGGGIRLWPLSTDERPKQFLTLFHGKSLYQLTLERVIACGINSIHVITNERYFDRAREQAAKLGLQPDFILEPMRRDSAPAIAAAVSSIQALSGPNACIAVLPCDHLITDHAAFGRALDDAVTTLKSGLLVTFGIQPSGPSTEYGYIEKGKKLDLASEAFQAASFKEKPNRETAFSYLSSGNYFWNSGIFVFRAIDFAREAENYMPQIWSTARSSVELGRRTPDALRLHADAFGNAEKISIDFALFEKSKSVALLPRNFAWSDVGNWASVHEAVPRDADGNASVGDAAIHESQNTLAYGEGVRVIALGLNDVVVIASAEGVFVAPMSRAAEIKNLL